MLVKKKFDLHLVYTFSIFCDLYLNKIDMQREEKQLEAVLEVIINRLNDLKHSIGAMIHKLENEYETIHWPTFLDNFALISSHV